MHEIPEPTRATQSTHIVQFYDSDAYLASLLADFVADGAVAGEPVLIIATDAHRTALSALLRERNTSESHVTFLDAAELLATFMDGTVPDREKFMHSIAGLFAAFPQSSVRVYGEMVELLWRAGNAEGVIRLEELWNELAADYSFSLLCGYPIDNFSSDADSRPFAAICNTHSHVIPAESAAHDDVDARNREIAQLQQRAAALEAEVAHRRRLERSLRDALTARRDAESALRCSERDLSDFVENATIGLHWVGPDGVILWANPAEMKLLGYTAEEYIGRNISEFHADSHTIRDILRRLVAGEEIHDCEARLRAKDGSIKHVLISSNVLFEGGEFVHTRCFTRDITDRKRLEDERAFLLEATTLLNGALSVEERLAELQRLVVPRLADICTVDLNAARSDGPRISEDEATLTLPLEVADRWLGAITFAYHDSRRRYDRADLPLALELARRAAMAIDNARLYELACESNRAKDDFLATLSHELRTPLTAILGWARLMLLGGLDEDTQRLAVETIERSARTQSSLIDDLLDLSRVVTGKLSLQPELLDLATVVHDATQTLFLAAEAKDIHLDVEAVPGRALVNGDPTRIQQVVWNLLANAVKFSEPGGRVAVHIETSDDRATIVVSDEGRGITPAFLPHVFEPFRQADPASTRRHGGLGLGLAIVKYLVEMHGGSVSVASEGEGHGATFTVTLPLALRHAATITVSSETFADLTGTSILLVDDDDATRNVVEAILRRCGADVRATSSVRHACDTLANDRPDVVITDIAMPDQDGFALLAYLRAHGAADVPAVALTAITATEERFRAAGFRAYVRKPVDPQHFSHVVAGLRD